MTLLVPVDELPAVSFPTRAKVYSTILLARFLSCWRRISQMDCHFENLIARQHFDLLTTWLRTLLGLRPGL
jgi:hypothetical protein